MPEPVTGDVTLHVSGNVATLTLRRPGKHNSLTRAMWRQLAGSVQALDGDERVRLIVVRGNGPTFSSGADLPEVIAAAGSRESARAMCEEVAAALHALATCSKLTVALLAHHTSGGGAEIALACDLRVAQTDVQFSIPVGRMGLVPDRLTVRRLLALGGPAIARSILLLGRRIGAEHCLRVGLVDEVVDVGGLDGALEQIVADLDATVDYSLVHISRLLVHEEALGGPEHLVDEFVESMIHGGVAAHGRLHYESLR